MLVWSANLDVNLSSLGAEEALVSMHQCVISSLCQLDLMSYIHNSSVHQYVINPILHGTLPFAIPKGVANPNPNPNPILGDSGPSRYLRQAHKHDGSSTPHKPQLFTY